MFENQVLGTNGKNLNNFGVKTDKIFFLEFKDGFHKLQEIL